MTSEVAIFVSYLPSAGHEKIRAANCTLSPLVVKGTIAISDLLHLKSVLHVLSISGL